VEYRLVDAFEQWKATIPEIFPATDIIYLPTNGAIRHWDREEAIALDILRGMPPSSIPYTRNSRFRTFLNRKLAGRIGFDLHETPPGWDQ
jgi:hypothetical protein